MEVLSSTFYLKYTQTKTYYYKPTNISYIFIRTLYVFYFAENLFLN